MTQPNPYANIPGFPGYPTPAAPAFPPGPVPAGIPAPVPAPVPASGYPAPYAAPAAGAVAPMPGAPVYPAATAGPVPAAPVGYPAPNAPVQPVNMPPLPDMNAAIAAATLGPDKYADLRDIPGGGDLKILDHARRCGTSKKTGKYYDVLAIDFEFISSPNPNFQPGTKCSTSFSLTAVGHAQTKEMERLQTFTHGLTGMSMADPNLKAVTLQVYRALAALDGQKPFIGKTVRAFVGPQANGKIDPKTGKPYQEVKFGIVGQ